MYWRTKIVFSFIGICIFSCSLEAGKEESNKVESPYSGHHVVVELTEISEKDDFVFVDLRRSEDFLQGHIPGAVNINRSEFQRRDLPYGGMALSADSMALLLSIKGITANDHLVLYDDKGGVEASRLWWILRMYGHEKVCLLNGGIHVWEEELEVGPSQKRATPFAFKGETMDNTLVGYEEFESWRLNEGVKVLDCRSADEFNGEYIKKGAFLAGHVEGAKNICYSNTLSSPDSNMKMKSPEELKAVYSEFFQPEDTILVYCQSGVRSAHTLMVLKEILGYKHVYNYDGSWIEWSYNKVQEQTIL